MNTRNTSFSKFTNPFKAAAFMRRFVGNLLGFAYRRHNHSSATPDRVSDGIHDVTGFEPHRFIHNQSLSFADLILPEDRDRVDAHVRNALAAQHRTAVTYRIMTGHRVPVAVTDRLVGVFDPFGQLRALEGVIDFAPPAAMSPGAAFMTSPNPHSMLRHTARVHHENL
jgi:hypothetical protein